MRKDVARMKYISRQLNSYGINFKRLEAIDGDILKELDTNLRRGQLGCYMSHLQAYREILNHGWQRTLILEDDITLTPWVLRMDEIVSTVPSGWDLIWVGNCRAQWPRNCCSLTNDPSYDLRKMTKINYNVYEFSGESEEGNYPMGGYAYLVSLKGATELLKLEHDFGKPIDKVLVQNSLKKYVTIPSLIIHCYEFPSSISGTPYHKVNENKDIAFDCVWTRYPEMQKVLFELLEEFHELASSLGIRYFLAAGTLLGYYRTQSIIPWDDDVDLYVYKEDIPTLMKAVAQNKQLRDVKSPSDGCPGLRYKIFLSSGVDVELNGKTWKWPFLDIFGFDLADSGSFVKIEDCQRDLDVELAKPFRVVEKTFYSADRKDKTRVYVPNQIVPFLEIFYGKDYIGRCKPLNWNHRDERAPEYPHDKIESPCGLVTPYKPLWLMFDEGPWPTYDQTCHECPCMGRASTIAGMLPILKEFDIGAIFALNGKHADKHPSLLREIQKDGHQIINHSWDHEDFSKLTKEEALDSADRTYRVFFKIIGEHPKVFQFPYLRSTKESENLLKESGYDLFNYSYRLGVGDYTFRSSKDLNRHIDSLTLEPHQFVIGLHNTDITKASLKHLIQHFKDKGYSFHRPNDNLEPMLTTAMSEGWDADYSDTNSHPPWNIWWKSGVIILACLLITGVIWLFIRKKK